MRLIEQQLLSNLLESCLQRKRMKFQSRNSTLKIFHVVYLSLVSHKGGFTACPTAVHTQPSYVKHEGTKRKTQFFLMRYHVLRII